MSDIPATYTHLTSSGLIKSSPGNLRGFYVNSTTSGTIQFFDNTAGSGTAITGVITPAAGAHILHDISFTKACYAAITGTLDVTIASWE